jgi:hypothetical protein
MESRRSLILLVAGAFFALLTTLASAEDAKPGADPASADPARQEQKSLRDFGAENPTCGEWNDGCSTCKRDSSGEIHCSTPGIACQPGDRICKTTPP